MEIVFHMNAVVNGVLITVNGEFATEEQINEICLAIQDPEIQKLINEKMS